MRMQQHLLVIFFEKFVRFGQIWLDLGKIETFPRHNKEKCVKYSIIQVVTAD